ncbi:alpha-L-rhamnosidase [Treponema primitia]|uniref:alpha-L-rhamnosidase n=1 Tax=Treponema primitia TaxID=88058 RepID=UPI0002554EBB|nr:alpha-L-rhamnosidase [Treponema primitia]
MLKVVDIRCEYRVNPVGVFTEKPRFSWKIETDKNKLEQTAYAIEVAQDKDFSVFLWQSGKVNSRQSLLITYEGKALASSTKYYWRVKIWDNQGEESSWGDTAFFISALFSNTEWKGYFISGEDADSRASSAGTLVRKEFTLSKDIKSALLYAGAKGVYEAYLNGAKVGDYVLTPGFTEYQHRLLFQTYDITDRVTKGANALGFLVGPGWYKGDLAGWLNYRGIYGNRTAVIAQIRVEYSDGTVELIASDDTWKRSNAPVTYSELYHGEHYDARLEQPGWDKPGFADGSWKPVYVESKDLGALKPQDGVPVKEQEYFKPREIITTPQGDRVIDFGQNISGWVRFKVSGKAGDKVRIRHAEVLDAAGNFYTENLRTAKQTNEYILKGSGVETYAPHLTFQGFRYVAVDEYPGEIKKENFEAVAIYSDIRSAGIFSCSHPKINQFISNVRWSMKDNFVDIPTDCPQRDERLGWTGDAQIFVRAASYLMETAPFFRKWLRDLAASQYPDGQVPHVVPDVLNGISQGDARITQDAGACAWGDVAVVAPWTIYTYFGDKELLAEQYPSMKKWVEYIHGVSEKGVLWNTGFQFGDWVALDAKEGSYFGATPNDLSATAYYAYSTSLLAKCAAILGKDDDAKKYTKLREDIGEAYKNEFFSPRGRLVAPTQTAHILSLVFDLTPAEYKNRTIAALAALLAENDNHLTTGFLGTAYILRALQENGRIDLAYDLLLKEDYPSWLYQINKGATTIWEHWDGLKPDGTMWSPDMNSFNHYAYGAVCDWIFSVMGGIDTDRDKIGFAHSIIHPCPGGGINWAETQYESGYGLLAARWEINGGNITIKVTIPPNTTASVTLPKAGPGTINGTSFVKADGGASAVLGSGTYSFTYPFGG